MSNTRFIGIMLVLLAGLAVAGCGMHVTSDPVQVKHTITIDVQGFVNYCQTVCEGSTVCFEDCSRRFLDLLSDPQICTELNACIR